MNNQINERNLVEQFRAAFPELEDAYQKRVRMARGEYLPGNYEVMGFVLKPWLKRELETGAASGFIRRSANFIERVCESGDLEALNAIWIEIFEWLITEPRSLAVIWPVLGKGTKAAIKGAAGWVKWFNNAKGYGFEEAEDKE